MIFSVKLVELCSEQEGCGVQAGAGRVIENPGLIAQTVKMIIKRMIRLIDLRIHKSFLVG
jgi:hypothetical protein